MAGHPGRQPGRVNGQLSTGGSLLTTYHADGKALLWDISQPTNAGPGRPLAFWPPEKEFNEYFKKIPLTSVLSPDGHWLAVGGRDLGVQLWDVSNNRPNEPHASPRTLHGQESAVPTAFAWSGDSRTLVIGYDDGKVRLDDVSNPTNQREPINNSDPVFNVLTSRTGNGLVVVGRDGTAVIWDIADPAHPQKRGQFPIGQVGNLRWSTALSADGRTFAIGHESAEVTLWDLTDPIHPSRLASIRLDHEPPVYAVAFPEDGNVLATGSQSATQLWDLFDRV